MAGFDHGEDDLVTFQTSSADKKRHKARFMQIGIEDQLKKVKIPGPSALALSAL